ncbi:MAG: hypothetical protein HZC19_02285 [Candidatus Omnitrophica bacterium]|nr:hypothetical protein [Candidatus Omnitrophota bacterium]
MNKRIYFALLLMGFTSLIVQTLLIREFLITFYGNELTIGLILANWIMLEALGSTLASRPSLKIKRNSLTYALLQAGISVYLPLGIFLIRIIKNMLGLTVGEGVGVLPVIFSSLFILAPLSLFDGAQFPFGCRMLSDRQKEGSLESAGRVYILEAIGFIFAGPLFTFLLITRFNSFSIAFLLGLVNLVSAALLLKDTLADVLTRRFSIIISALLILAVFMLFGPASKLQDISVKKEWRNQEVLSYQNSIYGNLAVTKSDHQYTFYSDGIPIITTPMPDTAYIESLVHFSLLSHPNPKRVLLVSGGAGGLINEILKYPVERIDYAELEPLIIKLINEFPTELTRAELCDPRLAIKYIDGRRYVRLAASLARDVRYDVVILNLPMPSTLQLNRFYTNEFFQNTRAILNEDGIFAFSLPGSLSYINPEMRKLNSSILNTLEDMFSVNVIPGEPNIYLSSTGKFKISPDIFLKRIEENKIKTKLLNRPYLEDRMKPYWRDWFKSSLSGYKAMRKNLDLMPSGTFYSIAYWNALFSKGLRGLFIILDKLHFGILAAILIFIGLSLSILMTAIPKLKRYSTGFAIFTTGFMGMSFDLIVIYAYQSIFGYVFSHIALLVTAFMAGLTLGSSFLNRRISSIKDDLGWFSKIELMIVGYCALAGPLVLYINQNPSLKFSFLFFILSGCAGCLVGAEFPLANKIYRKGRAYSETGGLLYGLDLFGAWLACLVVSIAFVPVLGILKTCIILAILKMISLSLVVLNSRRRV